MSASADRNLLFGILAVQLDFVTRDQLVGGMNAWLLDKARPLGDIFRDRGHLSSEELQHLAALVEVHLRRHGGDPQRSLAALSSVPPTLMQQLAALPDEAVQQSIAYVGAGTAPNSDPDPNRTIPQPLPPPEAVRYRILRPHARGGLGKVFVAEDTELGRPVALKEIQDRYAHDVVSRERFVREAEITGGLEHPGIVPVYGLGSYADGRPFYAMRFIKGDNLKAAIKRFHNSDGSPQRKQGDEKTLARAAGSFDSLEFRQLLRRFVDVCNAVAYAHSRGVLHRDLKPGNIMLGKYGETLLVDWGLAKPLGRSDPGTTDPDADATLMPRSGGDSSAATVAGQAMGTPAYMSPEQAAGRWDELGPATDIYSLGATLYELLAGRVPFAVVDLDAVQKGHFPPPRAVNPAVPRSLEAVCHRAMALRPADRYASALDVAREVERWLADEPVTAWREPLSVRAWRWVRRNRTPVTAAAALLLTAVAALGIGLSVVEAERVQTVRAKRDAEDALAALAAQEAETQRALAAEKRRRRQARGALDTLVSQTVEDDLAKQPAPTAEQRGLLTRAIKAYEELAVDTAEDEESQAGLAEAYLRISTIRRRLDSPDWAVAYSQAVTVYERLVAEHPDNVDYYRGLAKAHNGIGMMFATTGDTVNAEAAYRRALDVRERLASRHPKDPRDLHSEATQLHNLAENFKRQGNMREADRLYREGQAVRDRLAVEHPDVEVYQSGVALNLTAHAELLARAGRSAEAATAYRRAIEIRDRMADRKPLTAYSRQQLGRAHSGLAVVLVKSGERSEANRHLQRALEIAEVLAREFPGDPSHRRETAHLRQVMGTAAPPAEVVDQLAELRAAVAAKEKLAAEFPTKPGFAIDLGGSYCNLGNLLMQFDTEAALDYHTKAVDRLAAVVATEPRLVVARKFLRNSHVGRASDFMRLGRFAEAITDWDAALEFDDGSNQLQFRANRAGCLARLGRVVDAAREAGEVAADLKATVGIVYDCACTLALASGRPDNPAADAHAARAIALLQEAIGKGYHNIPHLLADPDLAPLRRRDVFTALLWDLADLPAAAPK